MLIVGAIVIGAAVCVGGGFYLGYKYGKRAVEAVSTAADAVKETAGKL